MADNKNRIIVYRDWITTFESLSDEEAGRLIKHFFSYINDKNPVAPDRLTSLLFEPIKQALKRDLKKYEAICLKNSENVNIRWNKKDTTEYDRIRTDTKHTDIDTDTDKDIDKDKEKNIRKPNKSADFINQVVALFVQEHGSYEIVNRGKERAAASKILEIYKKKYPAATSEETLEGLRHYFQQCINIQDSWLMNNMSLSIIVSKFNEINKILKNGTAKKSGATYADIARITHENFPEQFK